MNLVLDILITIILISIFCFSHSVLASNKIKRAIRSKFGNRIAYYRIGYNIISFISLFVVYILLPRIDIIVYSLPNPYNWIILSFQFISLFGFVWSAKYFSAGEFFGFNQIKRLSEGMYKSIDLDENSTLRIEGPYKYSRHPVYFFSIMVLVLRIQMSLTYFIIVVIFVLYFYIGSIFEEKRLIEKFGEVYISYQKSVPRIFPIKMF